MLVHHDARNYAHAASEAATEARVRMQKIIANGAPSAAHVFDVVQNKVPEDRVARGKALRFGFAAPGTMKHAVTLGESQGLTDENGMPVAIAAVLDNREPMAESCKEAPLSNLLIQVADQTKMKLHDNAFGQICGAVKAPRDYVRGLIESGEPRLQQLALEIMNRHMREASLSEKDVAGSNWLLRSLEGQLRGFLSDKYRRLDSRMLVTAFAEACQKVGAQPVDGVVSETRIQIKAYLPIVLEPVKDEPMIVGLAWSNSDYGKGSHNIDLTLMRLWCTNRAVVDTALRNVHLGSRLGNDIAYSAETYRKDTEATASAIGDIVADLLAPGKVDALCEAVRRADEKKIEWRSVERQLAKVLAKDDIAMVEKLVTDCNDVQILPPQRDGEISAWRMSNALSWFAGQTKDADKQMKLESLAGDFLDIKVAA